MDEPRSGVTTDAAPAQIIAPTFAPGVLIAGRYRLESRVGAGGGGTVWRCTDEKLAMTVALKIIGTAGELERWRREVAMARRIADRNVCRVHDLGEADGLRFVTMELVDGTGLRTKLEAGLAAGDARALFTQIVSGVAAIHAADVVHRDLKPDNVVVAADGRAVIVDFGLAREPRGPHDALAEGDAPPAVAASPLLTKQGVIVGTPRYMSPEQAAGDLVDARTDVWALGLIGYELLTGEVPKLAEDGKARVVDVAKLAAWPAIAPVLRKCLALAPDDRFQDARALYAALPGDRRVRRGLVVAVGAVALAGVVAAGVMLATRDDDSTAKPVVSAPAPRLEPPTRTELGPGFSVTLSPDGKEYAYTSAGGALYVRALVGGEPREWKVPQIELRGAGGTVQKSRLVTTWAVGWFNGHSICVAGISETGTWHVLRVFEDGRHTLLYSTTERFTASAAGDIAAIGIHESGINIVRADKPEELEEIEPIGNSEAVMGIAVSPDAKRVVVARRAAGVDKAVIQVITLGGDTTQIWSGSVSNDIDQLVVWLDNNRIAFVQRPRADRPVSSILYVYDLRTRLPPVERYRWQPGEYAGIGSAAAGELLIIGGEFSRHVSVGGPLGEKLSTVHDATAAGALPAGWTDDGKLVFQLADRIVRVAPGGVPEPWPGLTGGERPNAVLGDSLIAHHVEGREIVIEKISSRGTRKELHRMPAIDARYVVRCAGEHDRPCFLEEMTAREVTWRLFYPNTGEVGRLLHKRLRRELNMQTAAISGDGKTLAVVEGTSELFLVDIETGNVRTHDSGTGIELQTVAFAPDGSLWATTVGYRGDFFALLRFGPRRDGGVAAEPKAIEHGPSRFFWRPTPSPDGKYLAVAAIDMHLVVFHMSGV